MDLILNKQSIFRLLLIALWISGQTGGSEVNQIPLLWQKQGENATIGCSHTKGASYFQMYWYRQLPGENMKLIVFTALGKKEHDFEGFSTKKFSATKPDAQRGTFSVLNLEAADNGLYFCAELLLEMCTSNLSPRPRPQRTVQDRFWTRTVMRKTGASDTKQVDQTPPFIIKKTGQSVDSEIKCSHKIPSFDFILWYKQDEHKALHLLGYLNLQFVNLENNVKGKINFTGDGRKDSSLTVYDLKLSDSAVYFCAAKMPQCCRFTKTQCKNLLSVGVTEKTFRTLNTCSQEASQPEISRFFSAIMSCMTQH